MLARLASRLTYANVMATVAVFLALGGGAYAALELPKNSVGTKQLKNHAVTPKKVSPKAVKLFKGQRGAQGPAGPSGSGFAEDTAETALSGTPPVVVSLGQTRGTRTQTTGLLKVRYRARLAASGAFDLTTSPAGGDVWCFLEYAPSGGGFVQMSSHPAEIDGAPDRLALPVLGSADVGPGTYDVRGRCGKTGTTATATDAQLSVTATAR